MLHIHGVSDTSKASESIFRYMDGCRDAQKEKEILTYFSFKKHNNQSNSVATMLNTLLIQGFRERQDLYRAAFAEMSRHSSWTQTNLLHLFRNVLSSRDHGGNLCVINGMSECDTSRLAFLENICSFGRHTERRSKIDITSCDLQSALTDWPTINLDDHREGSNVVNRDLASDIDLDVLQLMQQRPRFYDFEKESPRSFSNAGKTRIGAV